MDADERAGGPRARSTLPSWVITGGRSLVAGERARGRALLELALGPNGGDGAAAGALLIVLTDNTTTVTLLALGDPITARCQTIKISRAE